MSLFNDSYDQQKPQTGGNNKPRVKYAQPNAKAAKGSQENQYRIAPPLGNATSWWAYSSVHWGYKTAAPNKPEVLFSQRFGCIRKKVKGDKTKIETECPECLAIENIAKEKKAFVELTSKNDKIPDDAAAELWDTANPDDAKYLENHRLEKKFICYALNRNNEWCLLKLNSFAFQGLKDLIEEIKTDGEPDPIKSTTGAWFEFNPINSMPKGQWRVKKLGKPGEPPHQLTENDAEVLGALPKLNSPSEFGVRILTEDEIVELVESKGAVAAHVFDRAWKRSQPKLTAAVDTKTVSEDDMAELAAAEIPSTEEMAKLGL